MDRGTRNYVVFLVLLVLGLALLFGYESPKVSELNQRLAADPELNSFSYRFRVVRLDGRKAVMSTPRSTEVPVERILHLLFDDLTSRQTSGPRFQQAQRELARIQTKARDMVLADPAVERVSWELDRDWLMQHGVQLVP
ncbi:hypothetical protein [Candidatus Endoriftia persephone]|jgi:hypothetical protein|uniref:Glutamate-ammonia-ligase adenylyltransferase n=5 Tax=Gammaproteobacteria TaxID=1236 RepID=G2DCE0_9GAMM|nr:hypothetical protein [Candidatus Endoriftia persephone]EGV51736.1 hypothetical protein Rifp1Sym_ba00300 [endosymbiont of Riftia pachyptila (vent Ph05)]KRT55686.1 hypothetical protein Ga0074115_12247 [endosymbiont of Ridgeia piscesae]USF87958.1 glutamate-ammonia-ligase adenylyltransferase [Candidatus Endoriftia persephone]